MSWICLLVLEARISIRHFSFVPTPLIASLISLASWYAGGFIKDTIRRSNFPVSSYFRSPIRSFP
uniref:Uncharacterized protein n=1 Tax=Anguilla anguilla TaxID=7936 RepID=A0A0E9SVW0_ANGAN